MTSNSAASAQLRTSIGFFLLVAITLLLGMLVYKTSGPNAVIWSSRSIAAAVIIPLGTLVAIGLLVSAFRGPPGERRMRFWIPLAGSALIAVVCLALAEVSVRALARPDPLGSRVGVVPLIPYDWRAVADTYLAHLRSFRSRSTAYFVEDTLLGWTVGVDRESPDQMYRSSDDGIRTGSRGEALRGTASSKRVALFGDSYTFSMEVPFEESWGHYLTKLLPSGSQVLNFGVDGFGVDQTYLRFVRDSRKWAPTVAVFTLIQDDLYRVVSVYPFLRGWGYPFSRPRFVLDGDGIKLLNVPVFPADSIFARASIEQLPLMDMDVFFNAGNWARSWLYHSYLVRSAVTVFPRWRAPTNSTSEPTLLELSSRIVQRFVREARAARIQPIIVYLPSRADFIEPGPPLKERFNPFLEEKGVHMNDLTACLTKHVSPSAMFLEGKMHYSAAGNTAVAKCMQPLIAPLLAVTSQP